MKKPDLDTKVGKYFIARKTKGLNKTQAQLIAGFADAAHATRIESTKEYQALTDYYKDELLGKITMSEIAGYHADNIRQDKDRGARNKAIELALSRIEPDPVTKDQDDKVMVILRG